MSEPEDPVSRFRENVDRVLTGNVHRIRNMGDPLHKHDCPKEPGKAE